MRDRNVSTFGNLFSDERLKPFIATFKSTEAIFWEGEAA